MSDSLLAVIVLKGLPGNHSFCGKDYAARKNPGFPKIQVGLKKF